MHGILLTCVLICFTVLYVLLYFTFNCPRQCACVPYVLLFNNCLLGLIIINVTYIFIVRDVLLRFYSGQNTTKSGRITKRCSMSNLVKPKFGLRPFRIFATSTVAAISKRWGKNCVPLFTNSFNFPPIFKLGRVYHGNTVGDLRWLVPLPLNPFRRNGFN